MISVIIPTLNRATLLRNTLLSITKQTISKDQFEVIVVDNGSTDHTQRVVTESESSLNVRCVVEEKPGLHEGRHRGLVEASGDILTFADDDIYAMPSWLEGISESFTDPHVGLVGGKNIPDYESPPPSWLDAFWTKVPEGKYMTYFSLLDFGDNIREVNPYYVFGCNFSIRKSLVVDAGGFHPDGMPQHLLKYRGDGESYVAKHVERSGYKTIYNPKASVKHWVPASRMHMDYMIKRAFSEGITQSYIDTRSGNERRASKSVVRSTLSAIKGKIKDLSMSNDEKAIRQSFLSGYRFHQAEIKKDKELLNWVTKPSYLPER